MCGILGFTHRQRGVPEGRIHALTGLLHHRGPDESGVYQSPSISLGTTRLQIIDPVPIPLPLSSEDGQTVIVYNGEVHNYQEIRAELEERGHRFRTHTDTEVVLNAFLEWDLACLARFRGMFAFAIWVEPQRRLVLARDHMGIKPLYYCQRDGELYFGSELKVLLGHPEIDRTLDHAALWHYLFLNYVPGPATLVENLRKLPPGHWLEWRDGRVRLEAWWHLPAAGPRKWKLEDATQELDRLLRDSVRERLISDVPLGIWLSGGIDSSTILHYAAESSSRPLEAFSVSFPGRSFDEGRWFREVASRYGARLEVFELEPNGDLPDTIERMVWHSDEPSADAGAIPVWFLSRMCRHRVTVALSGEGADEVFGGYTTYLANRYAAQFRWAPAVLRRGLLSLLRYWPVSDDKISFEYKLKRFVEGSLLPAEEAHHFWNGTFDARERQELLLEAALRPQPSLMSTLPAALREAGPLNRFLFLDQTCYLPDDILNKCDRMSMAHSLEIRPPFLDHRIVEFAASLPERFKIQGSTQKVILRALVRDKIPASVLRRRKEGFDIPVHEWLRGPLRPLLEDTLSQQAVEDTRIFRWDKIRHLMSGHLERRRNAGYHLWGLLLLFLWIRQCKIQTLPASRLLLEEREAARATS